MRQHTQLPWRIGMAAVLALLGRPAAGAAGPSKGAALLHLDRGGFSVEFRGAGRTPVAGEEMLANGDMEESVANKPAHWQPDSYVWLPLADPAQQGRMERRVVPLMRWERDAGGPHGGRQALRLAMPPSAYDARDPAGHEFCAMWHQRSSLPALAADTRYVLSYHHRGSCAPDVPNSRAYVRATFLDDAGNSTRVYAQTIFQPSAAWRRDELQFSAPRTTRHLDIRIALTGVGEVWFDDVSLRRTLRQENGPSVRLMPGAFLDNRYCLATGDPGSMLFGFRNESGRPIGHPYLVLQLPQGVEVLAQSPQASVVERKNVQVQGADLLEHRFDLAAWKGRIRDGTFAYPYNQWEGLQLLVRTHLPAGPARRKAWYWLEDGDTHCDPLSFDIEVLPPLRAGTVPRRFRSGVHFFLLNGLPEGPALQAFADLYRRVGFNAAHVPPSPLGAELAKRGIERYTQPFANGYTFGDATPGKKPADAVFRLADGQPLWEAICPVEVYKRGAYFREAIEDGILRRILVRERQTEQIMANWEPPMYNGRGCFCDRCRQEFRTFSKLPDEEVRRVWPARVLQEHQDAWLKFRSWQHAQLVITLEETVHAVGKEAGLDCHFIPEIHSGQLTPRWAQDGHNREFAAVDYLGKVPVLEPWGPYAWFLLGHGAYDPIRGYHLATHATAREVREFVDGRVPAAQRPRLIAFPFGTYEGATQPEALAFEFVTYLQDGYTGAIAYLFPGGSDARYWQALADANRLIARFEPFVFEGRPARRHTVTPATPLPRPDPRFLSAPCGAHLDEQRWKDASLLQSWEFERAGTRLIAAGNFWEEGDCFFRLSASGLAAGRKYVLREPAAGRCYAGRDGRVALDARALSRGVLLHAGAMRFAFFVVEPYRAGTDYGQGVTPAQMVGAKGKRQGS